MKNSSDGLFSPLLNIEYKKYKFINQDAYYANKPVFKNVEVGDVYNFSTFPNDPGPNYFEPLNNAAWIFMKNLK